MTDVRAVLGWIWRNRRNVLFWVVFLYLLILGAVLAVGSIHDAIVGSTSIVNRG